MTSNDLLLLFRNRSGLPTEGLVAYWKMDEGEGQELLDSGSNNNPLMVGSTTGADTNDPTAGVGYWGFDGVDNYCRQEIIDSEQGNVSINVTDGSAALTDDGQDFTAYIRSGGSSGYIVVVKDEENDVAFGYCGELNGAATSIKLYSTKTGTTQNIAVKSASFDVGDTLTYEIRKSDFQITSSGITAGFWIKSNSSDYGPLFGKYRSDDNTRSWTIWQNQTPTTKLSVFLTDSGVTKKDYESSVVTNDNTWRFFAFTWDGTTLKLYPNGELDTNPTKTTDNAMTNLYDTPSYLSIGHIEQYATYATFSMTNVFLYNRAVSAGEISTIYTITQQELVNNGLL